ncbi:hypothetical protein [Gordonia rhizosphera]|uniref:ASCH domain-containing protein n=1 Tax=Gordonia rhizosphera NBRC 16068 TaxID=1108045 RepID=K6VQ62_9ACTN|nr:hypothetical protein [Gordonia rhizosphera]GAB89060.1 hypothetical protein GORHZ_048_00370 [Gordonia rhizosphera NBRC 16068]
MLLPAPIAQGVADGSVDLAFRRWEAARVRAGSTFTTSAGVVEITSVQPVDPSEISDDDAARAGFATAAAAIAKLRQNDDPVFRIGLRWVGPDPRIALREDAELSEDDVADLTKRLDRLDARSTHGPWTRAVLEIIARRPAVVSTELAAELGRPRADFKLDVRKLKKLGVTHSLEVGYELSPRGRALLERWDQPPDDDADSGR